MNQEKKEEKQMSKTKQFEKISQCQNHLALGLQKDKKTDDSKVIIVSHFETEDDLALMLIKLFTQEPQMMETFKKAYNFVYHLNK